MIVLNSIHCNPENTKLKIADYGQKDQNGVYCSVRASPSERKAKMVKVLIVEDDPGIRVLTSRLLTREGHQVDCASDGAEGLERALSGNYDLVLSDVLMPRMSGVRMVEALRSRGNNTPVHLMSGDLGDFADEAQALIANGIVLGVLWKPFKPEQVRLLMTTI